MKRMLVISLASVVVIASGEALGQETPEPGTPAPGTSEPGTSEPETWQSEIVERLNEVEDRLDKAEKHSLLDRITLSAEYRTIFNFFHYKGPTSDPWDLTNPADPMSLRQITTTTKEVWSHRLRLKMIGEPVPSLRFTARLVCFRHFGDQDSPMMLMDSQSGRVPRDTSARFDQLWIDWFMFPWLALSAGRVAWAEGNPNELRENSDVQRGTAGLQMVDGEYETLTLTLNLSRWLTGTYLHAFYASWFNDNDDDAMGGFPFLSSGTDNLRIIGGNLDLVIPRIGRNFVQLGYYIVPRFTPFFVPIPDPAWDPNADYKHAPSFLSGSLLFPSRMPDSLGSYQNFSMLVELYDLLGTNIDLFVAGAVGLLSPNGKGIEYDLEMGPGNRQSVPFLFLASQGDDGTTFFFYAGFRYTFPIRLKPKVGFEYNHGSRYAISFATPTDQLLTKLDTRGSAYEAYAILPINKHLFLRASYLFIDNTYMTGFFGPNPAMVGSTAPRQEKKIHNFQLTLNASI